MTAGNERLSLLERLDLALAARVVADASLLGAPLSWQAPWREADVAEDGLWVSRVLALRGLLIDPRDATSILRGGKGRYSAAHQELHLVRGLGRILEGMRERAAPPDGWTAMDDFRRLTEGVPRFANNVIRRDVPWDGVHGVTYPPADGITDLLDHFRVAENFGLGAGFANGHPVRQAVQVFWRFARIAPFPDLNVVMAFVMLNGFLLGRGYPRITPLAEDRALLVRAVLGRRPQRLVQFETRLVAQFENSAPR
ncbi:MAG: hypothetical protein AAF628_33630 [Planctomycetota bacterium]